MLDRAGVVRVSERQSVTDRVYMLKQQNERLQEWQPIETAPKDGSEVLLAVEVRAGVPHCLLVGHYMPGGHCIEDHPPIDRGWYFWNGCMFDKAAKPTHWMELPNHPQRRAALEGQTQPRA